MSRVMVQSRPIHCWVTHPGVSWSQLHRSRQSLAPGPMHPSSLPCQDPLNTPASRHQAQKLPGPGHAPQLWDTLDLLASSPRIQPSHRLNQQTEISFGASRALQLETLGPSSAYQQLGKRADRGQLLQMKEQDKVPKEELSDMEIVNLPDKEYKVMD